MRKTLRRNAVQTSGLAWNTIVKITENPTEPVGEKISILVRMQTSEGNKEIIAIQ